MTVIKVEYAVNLCMSNYVCILFLRVKVISKDDKVSDTKVCM